MPAVKSDAAIVAQTMVMQPPPTDGNTRSPNHLLSAVTRMNARIAAPTKNDIRAFSIRVPLAAILTP